MARIVRLVALTLSLSVALGGLVGCRTSYLVGEDAVVAARSLATRRASHHGPSVAQIDAALQDPVCSSSAYTRLGHLDLSAYRMAGRRATRRELWQVGGPGDPTSGADVIPYDAHGHPTSNLGVSGRLFPLFGAKVESKGHDLPLPVGISAGGFYSYRAFEITKLDVTFAGQELDLTEVVVEPRSDAWAANVKVDLWVLPFLQLYGFYGQMKTETKTFVSFPDPRPAPPGPNPPPREEITLEIPTDLDGQTLGGGIVLAGGYKGFWASLNSNYSWTDLGLDDVIEANLNGLRVGYHKKFRKLEVSAWLGAVYWNVAKQVAGTIPLPGAEGGTIEFDVEYEPVEPINMLVGTRITWNKHFELIVEYGFWDQVDTLAIQGGFRF